MNLFRRSPDTAESSGPLTMRDRQRMAMRPPSFTDLLPWTSFSPDDEVFDLNDGASVGALLDLTPTATEAMPLELLRDRHSKVLAALKSVPEEDPSEWIVQFFVYDDIDLAGLTSQFEDYIRDTHASNPAFGEQVLQSKFTRFMIDDIARHVAIVSNPDGVFKDTKVSDHVWKALVRRVWCVIYRKYPPGYAPAPHVPSPRKQLQAVVEGIYKGLREAQVAARRGTGADFYRWMLSFFNRPEGKRPGEVFDLYRYPGDSPYGLNGTPDDAPLWLDLAESVTLSRPTSHPDIGCWEFDGALVRALTLQQLIEQPSIGLFTAELDHGGRHFARFDRLPPGSMLSMTIQMRPQHLVRDHIERIDLASRAKVPEAQRTKEEAGRVLRRMADDDKLVPMFLTLYVAGSNTDELNGRVSDITAQFQTAGLRFIQPNHDLTPLDAFVRGLPMCFDPYFDTRHMRRSKLVFLSQIAAMVPVYGRQRGTGHPGLMFWNRGGEPLWFDPLNKFDRSKNAHKLIFGPTGSGKSATLNYELLMMLAVYRPRLVIVDAGNSFGLMVEFCARMGLSTHVIKLNPQADVSLPPFVLAHKLLDDPNVMDSFRAAEQGATNASETLVDELAAVLVPDTSDAAADRDAKVAAGAIDEETSALDEKRDILGEMVIAAIMMITGGEEKEILGFGRADRFLVSRAIIRAALASKSKGTPHPLVHDVAVQLMAMRDDTTMSPARRERAELMGHAMIDFTQGLRGKLFNRYGADWPDVDVMLVEMGMLIQDDYKDALALAYSSLIDHVQAKAEANQHDGRHGIFLTDEGHIITTNSLLGPKVAKGTKMWRKLKTWFWLATQNIGDFPDHMARILSMCEWWLLLTMEKGEIDDVARFKTLTKEQRLMLESTRKEPPKYTEGVVLSTAAPMLIRNVPPPLAIALAMTEGHEKLERAQLMQQHGCSELDAALRVAERIAAMRSLSRPRDPSPAKPTASIAPTSTETQDEPV